MTHTDWLARVSGHDCPLDAPRPASNEHWDLVATLSASSLYLSTNQTYRGQCLLIFDPRHIARMDQLTRPEWAQLAADLYVAQQAIARVLRPDHLNIESLGNVVPHLHWHIIPRYQGDPRWGLPIWETPLDAMPVTRLPEAERDALIAALRRAMTGNVPEMTAVGLTSRWVAANRALETDGDSPLYRDPFARELAGDDGMDMMYAMRAISGMPTYAGPDPFLTIRTRFFDDGLLAAVADGTVAQVVILAAGMDARAFRLQWPGGVTLFEVDRDDVFRHKEGVLTRLGATPTCDRRIVRQDLAHDWAGALVAAGFDRHRPAAFLAEGLLYYLDDAEVNTLFATLRDVSAVGSWIGVDTMNTEVLTSPYMAGYMKRLAELGCPWKFGVDDPDAFFAAHGWQTTSVHPGEPAANYDRWIGPVIPRGVPGIPRTFLISGSRVS
jgi:methyltransferase (TIGR00027 family)